MLKVAGAMSEPVGMVDLENMVDTVDTVDMVEAGEPEAATVVTAPIANWTAILQMLAESGNVLRR